MPLLILLSVSVQGRMAAAATLNVPTQYPTIQAAITASQSGDTVLIADGTYTGMGNVDLDFGGRNITVTSQNGAAATVIDCGGSSSVNHRGFSLHSGETSAVISGLTIENGYESADNGAGIDDVNAGVTVQSCILKNNTATNGGGIYNDNEGDSPISVTGCTLIGNTASNSVGGGIYNLTGGSGLIGVTDCTLAGNAASDGGGIYNVNGGSNGLISVTNCTLTGNTANYYGGGIENDNFTSGSGLIGVTNCTLDGNTATNGGGVFNDNEGGSPISMTGCTLTGNTASGGTGGGIYNLAGGSSLIGVTNCTLAGNAASDGGGIYNDNEGGSLIGVTNCTLTGNTASSGTGGIDNVSTGSGTATLTNDILYGDTGGEIGGGTFTATYCDVQGGSAGTGNISVSPLFVNAPADLHLQPGTPCFGAGTAGGAPLTDKDGNARPDPPSIGAYEPVELASLSIPSPVAGGTVVTATVTLSGITPTDVLVGLSSSDSSVVRLHRAIIVPAGSSSATFVIHTYLSPVSKSVTIQAALGSVVLTAPLAITGR